MNPNAITDTDVINISVQTPFRLVPSPEQKIYDPNTVYFYEMYHGKELIARISANKTHTSFNLASKIYNGCMGFNQDAMAEILHAHYLFVNSEKATNPSFECNSFLNIQVVVSAIQAIIALYISSTIS